MKDLDRDILRTLLRPVVRSALKNSARLQDFVDILKELFVQEAQILLEGKGTRKKISISQISLTSGVHRIDVAQFVRKSKSPVRKAPTLIARVLSTWENSPKYTTKNGQPRVLPLDGAAISFRGLLDEVSPQLSTSGVLLELQRTGVAERTSRGVKLTRAVHFAGENQQMRVELLGSNVDTLIKAATDNIEGNVRPFHIHYRTEYDQVYTERLPQIRQWVQNETKKFHAKLRKYISKFDADTAGSGKSDGQHLSRYTAISFAHHEENPTSQEEEEN